MHLQLLVPKGPPFIFSPVPLSLFLFSPSGIVFHYSAVWSSPLQQQEATHWVGQIFFFPPGDTHTQKQIHTLKKHKTLANILGTVPRYNAPLLLKHAEQGTDAQLLKPPQRRFRLWNNETTEREAFPWRLNVCVWLPSQFEAELQEPNLLTCSAERVWGGRGKKIVHYSPLRPFARDILVGCVMLGFD